MITVPARSIPRPVGRWEGIELSYHRAIRKNVYRIHGHNLSFPRDVDTGDFVDGMVNPLTGKFVKAPPMALTNDPGMIAMPEGILSLDGHIGKPRKKYGKIGREGNVAKIDSIRVPPESWPASFIETAYEAAPAHRYDDPKQLSLPSDVSGAYVFPFPAWVNMGDALGHMFAIWSGHKLMAVSHLPTAFRQQAEAESLQLLQVDLKGYTSRSQYFDRQASTSEEATNKFRVMAPAHTSDYNYEDVLP